MLHLLAGSHDRWRRDTFHHDDEAVVHNAGTDSHAAAALATAGKIEDVHNHVHYAEAEEGTADALDSSVEGERHILVEESIRGVGNSPEEVGGSLVDTAGDRVEQKVDMYEVEEDLRADHTAVLGCTHVEVDNATEQDTVDVGDIVVVVGSWVVVADGVAAVAVEVDMAADRIDLAVGKGLTSN